MQQAQENDRVTIYFEGRLADGEVFDASDEQSPLSFRLGDQTVLPSLERAIIGMSPGQTRTISIPPDEGYGPHHEELEMTVARQTFGEQQLQPGMVLAMNMEREGQQHQLPAMVKEIEQDRVRVDFNHPLAGQELFYTITLKEVQPGGDQDVAGS